HLAQEGRVGRLLQEAPKGHRLVGHRGWSMVQGLSVSNPTLARTITMTANVTLAAAYTTPRGTTIIGSVSDLHSDNPNDLMNSSGLSITVVWESADLGNIYVSMSLLPEDY